ncbi:bacterial alpha-L-rhamnosidase domain protein [Pyrenochaeta sp. MPI-SDFR-AT-0127]|nr:bacterial alpha-L-rhamnosidase domain protein [Pyrenochaeta sp. MPI-SDFR-AT-0127]
MNMATVTNVRFEHHLPSNTLGVHEIRPRLSWELQGTPSRFKQHGYDIELSEGSKLKQFLVSVTSVTSQLSNLVPWPFKNSLRSRQSISIRVRVRSEHGHETAWSKPTFLETGLLHRSDWHCERIAAPWAPHSTGPEPETLFRSEFSITGVVDKARLYITAQGVYEAEINGERVGDHFLAPGWTSYHGRLQYQTHDITSMLLSYAKNCIGIRVAEGWFCGRIGFEGGHRNIWGPHPSLMAQLEVTYANGSTETVISESSWTADRGPIRLAELYDGEKYDATLEVAGWSFPGTAACKAWEHVRTLPPLPDTVLLTAGTSGPVKRLQLLQPVQILHSPTGKTIVDFGQNLVGYVRLKNVKGQRGHKITLKHAEVLEHGELCTRPLRICKAVDEYTLRGSHDGETYEPRFTFHGFRYVQIEDWPAELELSSVEAIVCHTDMRTAGSFSCSDPLLNRLYQNICWGMRGNFLSVPTDCPQRDERLGWSGDLALFAPTAVLIYDCFGMLSNWLVDVEHDQSVLGGVPPMVSPNSTIVDPVWCRKVPCAIWHDVTILAPWALYEETGDVAILARQYQSMSTWMSVLPRNKVGATHLWDNSVFQLGDWLDPAAAPEAPWKSYTDAKMIANMFLIHSLELMAQISGILGKKSEKCYFNTEALAARAQFHEEYVTPNGRLVSDTQAAYAIAICFDLLNPLQRDRAGKRLVELVRKNNFQIATGFAATPYICEALALTGHTQVAYSMLLEKRCPSWLYAVEMGATTVWERWDAMLADGTVNPGEMTSFNHYAYGAVAKFMYERVAGLQRLEPGWTSCRFAPSVGANFTGASATHVTPHGTVSCSWERTPGSEGFEMFSLKVSVPHGVTAEVVIPENTGERKEVIGTGEWSFDTQFLPEYEWPIEPLKPKS